MAGKVIQKKFTAKAQAVEGGAPGEFTALVSVFGNKDSQGDIMEKGAYTKTLAQKTVDGKSIPVVWSHQWYDIDSFLGVYTKAEETDAGLQLTGLLDIEESAKAARVYQLMKKGAVVEFSVSGEVVSGGYLEKAEGADAPADDAYHIYEMDLWEAGPCFKGANAETELLSVKSDGILSGALVSRKEGRVLAAKHVATLKTIRDGLNEVIDAVEKAETPDDAEQKAADPATKTIEAAPPAGSLDHNVRALLVLSTIE